MRYSTPKPEGFIEQKTGRVAVMIDKYHVHMNGKVPAYFFNASMVQQGKDPWREITGIEKALSGTSYEVHFKDGRWIRVGPMLTIFMNEEHAITLGVTPIRN